MTTIDLFPLPGDDGPEMTSPFDAIRHVDECGEHWFGRELQPLLGYSVWRDFANAIERAKITCRNSGQDVTSNFAGARKISGTRPAEDYRLSRYGAYLTALNGDPRKHEVAAAQTYFAVKTREAEVAPVMPDITTPSGVLAMAEQFAETARRLVAAERERDQLAPAAQSWEELASAEGDYSVADAAKTLSRAPGITIGRDRLFAKLREFGWVYRDRGDGRHRAYQTAVDRGLLVEMPKSHEHPDTGERVVDPPQIRVTVKGLGVLRQRLASGGELESA